LVPGQASPNEIGCWVMVGTVTTSSVAGLLVVALQSPITVQVYWPASARLTAGMV